jgi:hypothetical protein
MGRWRLRWTLSSVFVDGSGLGLGHGYRRGLQELPVEGDHDAADPHHDVFRGAEDHGRHLAMVFSGEAVSQARRRAGLGVPDHHLHRSHSFRVGNFGVEYLVDRLDLLLEAAGDEPPGARSRLASGVNPVVGFDCLLVARTPVRDLLFCAKHLFVAAKIV